MHNPQQVYPRLAITVLTVLLISACGGRGEAAIKARPQTISFAAAPALNLFGTATVAATASSGLAVSYSSNTPTICTVDAASGLVTDIAAGTCRIAADQSGNTEFAPAAQVTQNMTVINLSQSISFNAAPALTLYGHASVSATASSGLAVTYSSTTPGICTVNSTTGLVSDIAAGDCTIAANQAGDAYNYAAPEVTQTLTVAAWTGPITAPGAPAAVSATVGDAPDTVIVSFTASASSGGSVITGYTVTSSPGGISASGTSSPISVPCPTPCNGHAFTVFASNSMGDSAPSAQADVLTDYNVTTIFYEPDTQPNDTIFTGAFTFNSTTGSVSNLHGMLSESMTGPPMDSVPLTYQLSTTSDGQGGLLVTAFALNTTDTFAEGGFAPGSEGFYFGYPSLPNPGAPGGVGNAYIMIDVNLSNPTTALTTAQINRLAYADCTAGGMMGSTCMTGYSGVGTMGGYPVSQTITKK